ncbi:MAG: hypothetical protein AAFS10_11370 [Myxococcota bacterium]
MLKQTTVAWFALVGLLVACTSTADKKPTKPTEESTPTEKPKPTEAKADKTTDQGKDTKADKPDTKAPKAPPGLESFKATVNGEPLALQTAVAYSRGSSAVILEFSTAKPSCDAFSGNGRMLAQGEQHFSVTFASKLLQDGKREPQIGSLYFESFTKSGGSDMGTLTLTEADPKKGVKGDLDFTLLVKANEFLKTPEKKLVVKGPFEAKGCGQFLPRQEIAARPQEKLKVQVSGVDFPIQGAIVRSGNFPNKGYDLTLSTSPMTCDASWTNEDLLIRLHFAKGKAVNFVYMSGDVLTSQLNNTLGEGSPSIDVRPKGKLEGDGELMVQLKGTIDVLGHKVTTEGDVTVLRCPAQ